MKKTHFSLQFNMSCCFSPGECVKVDLLPTFKASVEGISGTYLTARVTTLRSPLISCVTHSFSFTNSCNHVSIYHLFHYFII